MEADTAFVGANSIVVLNTVTHVVAYVALVINPRHAELIDTIGDAKALNQVGLVELGMFVVLFFDGS